MSTELNPDWRLTPSEELAVILSMVMSRHIPGWPGATDEQLEAAAKDIIGKRSLNGEDRKEPAR